MSRMPVIGVVGHRMTAEGIAFRQVSRCPLFYWEKWSLEWGRCWGRSGERAYLSR